MIQTTKVARRISGATQPYYVAIMPDRKGNYRQFTQQEVENCRTGKFEICESVTARAVLKEFTPLAEGWTRKDVERQPRGNHAERLKVAFSALGLSPAEAALAARGPMQNGTDIDARLRGNALLDLLEPE